MGARCHTPPPQPQSECSKPVVAPSASGDRLRLKLPQHLGRQYSTCTITDEWVTEQINRIAYSETKHIENFQQ